MTERDTLMADIAEQATLVATKTTEELRKMLVESLHVTAQHLLHLAGIVYELEHNRNEDLSGLRMGMIHHLRKIACGQVLPEVVVRFAGSAMLINAVSGLPLDDQRDIVDGKSVKLWVYSPDGKKTWRTPDPMAMTPSQVRQVFAKDHIRGEGEQSLILDQWIAKKQNKRPDRIGNVRIDKERGGAMVGKTFVPLADLIAAVAALRA